MSASSNSGNKQDNVTNKNTPTVSIGEALVGETAVVTATSASGVVQCSFAVTESTKECALPTLTDGSWSISARLTDAAGNTSPQSPAVDIVVDTVAPATPAAPLNAVDNGTGISTDLTPSIVVNGVADGDNVVVAGVLGGKPEATCSFVSSAILKSCDMPKMKGGTWTLSARATDIAGNMSPESPPTKLIISVAVIPRAPVQPVIQAPAVNRSSSDVKLSFGQSAALAGVKMVTFVVTDANNKVVRKTTVKLNPEAKGAGIQIPTNLPGAKVQVFTGNECGVSPNAPDDMNIKRGKTATSVNKRGIPELRGDMILPAVDFGPSEIELDKEDKARLREVAKEVKGRCGTLFLSGFSRFNDKDSERYLQNLANFRAQAVADYLSSIGVKMWLVYQGFIVKSNDSSGLYRRVELRWEPA